MEAFQKFRFWRSLLLRRFMETHFFNLCTVLDKNTPVLVQTHDFPDHDAIGAAYALIRLLEQFGYTAAAAYGGLIQHRRLQEFIDYLHFPLLKVEEMDDLKEYQVVVVDGSPFKGTVNKLGGILKGVIDHHPARVKNTAVYTDIRPETGACCSIIWSYWKEAGKQYGRTVATALIAGIQLDTNFLSRHVAKLDMEAYNALYFEAEVHLTQQLLKTTMKIEDLQAIGMAFTQYIRVRNFLLIELKEEYSKALLSVLADFLLWIQDITFVTVIEVFGNEYRLSVRSRDIDLDAGYIMQETLKNIGSGGGHAHMAGGVLHPDKYPGKEALLQMIAEQSEVLKPA